MKRESKQQITQPMKRRRGWIAEGGLVVCAAIWGLGFVAMKDALSVYPASWLLFFRFGGGALLMGACFFRHIARATRSALKGGFFIGVFLFLGMSIQTWGLNYTTAGKQAFLTASYVVMVPLLLWGLRRVFPGWAAILGALVCFAGMGLLTSGMTGALNRGDVLTVASALFFALQIIAIGHYAGGAGSKEDPLILTFVQFAVAAFLSLCWAFLFEGRLNPQGTRGLLEIFYVTVFCTFFCFLVQNVAQKVTPPAHASILLGLESVFGALSGVVLLNEPFSLRMGAGCGLIFGAILLVELAPLLFPLPAARVFPSQNRCRQLKEKFSKLI
ncbi:MAG: DMT family transporter [Synergistaceae bacterium]|jgi:drug/metabolite transporter (DMT)-like permease|nr:DMT family transporter [Synergistaceae bacterium]